MRGSCLPFNSDESSARRTSCPTYTSVSKRGVSFPGINFQIKPIFMAVSGVWNTCLNKKIKDIQNGLDIDILFMTYDTHINMLGMKRNYAIFWLGGGVVLPHY